MAESCSGPPPLVIIALEKLASCMQQVSDLTGSCNGLVLPEELTCLLFERVLEKGKLTPRVLDTFERTQHEALLQRIAALGIRRWTPPLLPTSRNAPLGYGKPAWE